MNNNKILELINQYFDNELSKEKESFLFSTLAENITAREYFNRLHLLKSTLSETIEEFPDSLDESILSSLPKENIKSFSSNNIFFIGAASAFSVIFLFTTLFFYYQINNYKRDVENLSEKINKQNQTIEMLYYNIPGVTVSSSNFNN